VICEKLIKKYNKMKTGQNSRQESKCRRRYRRERELPFKFTV
jgi:hypothetical protein